MAKQKQAEKPTAKTATRLRVWWIPQIPMTDFTAEVADLAEAKLLLDTLAEYDAFQFEHRIKSDYSNTGGVQIFREGDVWEDWMPEDSPEFTAAVGVVAPDADTSDDRLLESLTLEQVRRACQESKN